MIDGTRPLALDLFCGAGGASMGLYQAGYNVIGVDIRAQPRYPFRFVQADALKPPFRLDDFDFIWASPKCQRWTAPVQQRGISDRHPDQITPLRPLLASIGVLWCIENVPRSPLRRDLILTGEMFGAATYRKRGPALPLGRKRAMMQLPSSAHLAANPVATIGRTAAKTRGSAPWALIG
jgi:DNA (cytosine-5)-methyltransferase 1